MKWDCVLLGQIRYFYPPIRNLKCASCENLISQPFCVLHCYDTFKTAVKIVQLTRGFICAMFFMNCSSVGLHRHFFENNAENKSDLRNLKFQNRKTSEWGNPLSKSTGSWTERTTMWCEKWRTLWFHSPSNLASAVSACTVANTQCQTFSWFFNFHGT